MGTNQIVLIEDNLSDVFLIQMALNDNGVAYEMTMFDNGQKALTALCPMDGSPISPLVPDAILLDLHTPKSDGFEVLIRIKSTPRLASVPIAILTSSQATSDRSRAASLGAHFIHKPSALAEFLATVGQAVKGMLGQNAVIESLESREAGSGREP